MAYRVLVVEDSTFFRRRVTEILNQAPDLEVIGEARNGEDAIAKVQSLKPDVVTMDIEMPVMDGITAVKEIMSRFPVPILMFSSLTYEGATATLDALDAGALDFLPKKFEDIASNRKEAIDLLQQKVRAIGRRSRVLPKVPKASVQPALSPGKTKSTRTFIRSSKLNDTEAPAQNPASKSGFRPSGKKYKLLAIGTSTGGPVALQTILTSLPANFPHPIILVQHMPGTFTAAFAERVDNQCRIKVKEAVNGETLKPGTAYLAPGGMQMLFEGSGNSVRVKVVDSKGMDNITYKPSVDLSFASAARVYFGDVLGIILTGMGADGKDGCRALKAQGAKIWAQDEKTCVVYGMPQAVTNAGISEASYSLKDFAGNIIAEMQP